MQIKWEEAFPRPEWPFSQNKWTTLKQEGARKAKFDAVGLQSDSNRLVALLN